MYRAVFQGKDAAYWRVPGSGSTHFLKISEELGGVQWERPNGTDHRRLVDTPVECRNAEWKIGLIRNPRKWLDSAYRRLRARGFNEGFGDYTPSTRDSGTTIIKRLLLTPLDWYVDESGEIAVDKIYRIEDIGDLFEGYETRTKRHKSHNRSVDRWGEEIAAINVPWDFATEKAFQDKFHRELEFYPELRI